MIKSVLWGQLEFESKLQFECLHCSCVDLYCGLLLNKPSGSQVGKLRSEARGGAGFCLSFILLNRMDVALGLIFRSWDQFSSLLDLLNLTNCREDPKNCPPGHFMQYMPPTFPLLSHWSLYICPTIFLGTNTKLTGLQFFLLFFLRCVWFLTFLSRQEHFSITVVLSTHRTVLI